MTEKLEKPCVFYPSKYCPVRQAFQNPPDPFAKNIKMAGDAELAKMFEQILDKMKEAFTQELSQLSNFCRVCPFLQKWSGQNG